ncbi:MAG: universal stress protein [Desulfobacterales bacterium]
MEYDKILLPYNFTSFDKRALDFVIHTFSDKKEAEVTLFNAYIPAPIIEMRGSPIMEQMKDNLGYLTQRVKEQKDELHVIKNNLLVKGFSENRVNIVFEPKKKDIAGDIIDLVQKGRYNVLVLNRKPGKIARFFAGSVSSRVLAALKDTAVCIVS